MPILVKNLATGKTEVHVRALLAVLFSLSIIAGFFLGKIDVDALLAIGGPLIGWYVGQRQKTENG